MKQTTPYQAGVCNINKREIAQRRRYGVFNVVIAGAYLVWLVMMPQSLWIQSLLVFPLFGAIISFWQARQKFCAGFALANMYENDKGEIQRVSNAQQQRQDQIRAVKMVAGVAVVSAVVTVIMLAAIRFIT